MRPVQGLAGIRTSLRQHVHSLPPSHRSPHLESHLLAKEKERLIEEIARLERRCCQCRQHLADIEARLNALAAREGARKTPGCTAPGRDQAPSRLARMTVEY